jgi:hypothetical protein
MLWRRVLKGFFNCCFQCFHLVFAVRLQCSSPQTQPLPEPQSRQEMPAGAALPSPSPPSLQSQKPSILENAENVGNAGGVAGDVRVPAPDKDSGSVVLPAEDSAIAKVVEDLLLDLLFEDGSGD